MLSKKNKNMMAIMEQVLKKTKPPFYKQIYLKILKYIKKKKKTGFTMIELLIALAILGILMILGAVSFNSSLSKARDSKRKENIAKLKISFENYYNDQECYPVTTVVEDCEGTSLVPYLDKIPCDPQTKDPYLYIPLENRCGGYRLLTNLENNNDPSIAKVLCNGENDCGWGGGYDYGVSAGTSLFGPDYIAPSPSPGNNNPDFVYACDHSGSCNKYVWGSPELRSCPQTFNTRDCDDACDDPAVRCD